MASLDWCKAKAAQMARDGHPVDAVGYMLERFSLASEHEQELTRLALRHDCESVARFIEGLRVD